MRPAAALTIPSPAHRPAKRRDDRPRIGSIASITTTHHHHRCRPRPRARRITATITTSSTTIIITTHHHEHGHSHSHGRVITLEQEVLAKNDKLAERIRGWLAGRDLVALNLVSSPGAGKTTLLERTIRTWRARSRSRSSRATRRPRTTPSAFRPRAPGRADQHRHRLPPRRLDGWPRLGAARPAPASRS